MICQAFLESLLVEFSFSAWNRFRLNGDGYRFQYEQLLLCRFSYRVFVSQTWAIHARGKSFRLNRRPDTTGWQILTQGMDTFFSEDVFRVEASLNMVIFGFSISKTNFHCFSIRMNTWKLKTLSLGNLKYICKSCISLFAR